jgi:predicted nucleotidyltransferase
MLRIEPTLLSEIVAKVTSIVSPDKILIFGSQVRTDAARSSDIDIALFGVPQSAINSIKGILNEDIKTLRDIDVVAFESITNERMKEQILKQGVVIYERSPLR